MNEKKATTRPPERRGVPKSQIRAERRQRAERKKKIILVDLSVPKKYCD